jgi:hypothetical protein
MPSSNPQLPGLGSGTTTQENLSDAKNITNYAIAIDTAQKCLYLYIHENEHTYHPHRRPVDRLVLPDWVMNIVLFFSSDF